MIFSLFALVLGHAGESHSHPTCYAKDTDRATVRLGETTCETKIVLDKTTLTDVATDSNDTIFAFDLRNLHCVMGSNLPANVTYKIQFKADEKDSSWTGFSSHKGAATFDPLLARKVEVKTSASSIDSLNAFLTSCDCVGEVKDPELAQRLQSSCFYRRSYCDSRLAAKTGWQPRYPHNNFLLIDLGSLHRVYGTVLKGFKVGGYRAIVKKYRVEWSRDNETWVNIPGLLQGPSSRHEQDIHTLVYANFSSPVIAQFVKIFHGDFENSLGWYPWPAMRAGVLAGELKRTLAADNVAGSRIVYDCAEGWHHKTENNTEVEVQCGENGFTEGLDTLCAMECFTSDTSNDTSNNSYCTGKYQDKPYCSNNLCVECVNDTQCAGNEDNKYCGAGNRCSPCESDSECAGKESGEYCSSSVCVQCTNHTHCANSTTGNFCSATNLCVLCSDDFNDANCSDGKHCLQEEQCVSCTENRHCSAGEECDSNNECITTTTTTTTEQPLEEITDINQIVEQGPAKYEVVESRESSVMPLLGGIAVGGLVLAAFVFFVYRRQKGKQSGVMREDALHVVKNSDADAGASGRRSRRSGSRRREGRRSEHEGTHSSRKSTHSGRRSKKSGRSKRTADSMV